MARRPEETTFWDRALRIDRRVIYALVFVALTVPFLVPGLKVPVDVSPPVRKLYDFIAELKEGDGILISFDYSPSTIPELSPMAVGLLRQCFSKGIRVYGVSLQVEGQILGAKLFGDVSKDYAKVEGEDWVNLGFKPGGTSVILGLGSDVASVYPTDAKSRPLGDIPAMKRFRKLSDLKLCISLSASTTPATWMQLVTPRFGVPVAAGITGVMVAEFYAYVNAGQLVGLLGGMKGAAEYERLLAEKVDPERGYGQATKGGMASLSAGHVLVVLFVLFGNVAMFASRASRARAARRRRSR